MPTDVMNADVPCTCGATQHADDCARQIVRKLQDRVVELETAARPFVWDRPYRVGDDERLYLSVSGQQMRRLEHAIGTRADETETTYLLTDDDQALLDAVAGQTRERPSGVVATDLAAGEERTVGEVVGRLQALVDAGLLLELPNDGDVAYRLSDDAHHYLAAR